MKPPTARLIAGALVSLSIVAAFAAYTLYAVGRTREVQRQILDRSRKASLQLLRIQGDLNELALAMRDMLDRVDGQPLSAWPAQFRRIRENLDDAIRIEGELSLGRRRPEQSAYLRSSFDQFWNAADRMFAEAARGNEEPARDLVRSALQPRQEALSAQIARLLVASNEEEQRAAGQMEEIYSGLERNTYIFLALSLAAIATISALLIRANRRVFARMEHLSKARSEIAESAFRAISRDLHDEFGQILTALGAMLRRAGRDAPPSFTGELSETQQAVQDALDKVRGLSQSLHPVILEEQGLDAAIRWHVAAFERQTGIRVSYSNEGAVEAADPHRAIHFFRVLQEALNNVAKHAGVSEARVHCAMRDDRLTLEVEDAGVGFSSGRKNGIGLAAMRERAGILDGTIQISRREGGGTRVLLEAPR